MSRFSWLLLAFAIPSLAACGLPPREPVRDAHMNFYDKYPDWIPGDTPPDETTAIKAPAAQAASPAPRAASPNAAAAASRGRTVLPPSREPPPEPPKLEELRGLDAGQLTQLLGKPTLLRDEATAQMWQYRGETCVLHLFLYPGAGGDKRVQYVEARPRQTGAAAAVTSGSSECLATLVGTRRLRS